MNAVDELNLLLGIGPKRSPLPPALQNAGYSSVKTLGKGTFGQALLLFQNVERKYYVAKHVNMASMTARQRADAHKEIEILRSLNHPNVVKYVDFCEEPPHLYIIMEYADGGDLYSHLRRAKLSGKHLSEDQIINLFLQVAMALKYLHDRRVLHRDIKSQNVFLTQSHVVKLGDFGISTVLQNTVAMAKTMCGTPSYFSPELCKGTPYNNKSDVWAFGVLLYEMCTGRMPFESHSLKRLMEDIVHVRAPRISSTYSDGLASLVWMMLEKDPTKRLDINAVLNHPALLSRVPSIVQQLSDQTPTKFAAFSAASDAAQPIPSHPQEQKQQREAKPPLAPTESPIQPQEQHPRFSPAVIAAAQRVEDHFSWFEKHSRQQAELRAEKAPPSAHEPPKRTTEDTSSAQPEALPDKKSTPLPEAAQQALRQPSEPPRTAEQEPKYDPVLLRPGVLDSMDFTMLQHRSDVVSKRGPISQQYAQPAQKARPAWSSSGDPLSPGNRLEPTSRDEEELAEVIDRLSVLAEENDKQETEHHERSQCDFVDTFGSSIGEELQKRAAVAHTHPQVGRRQPVPSSEHSTMSVDSAGAVEMVEEAAKTEIIDEEDVPLGGHCLCGAASFTVWLSYVYGSFTCGCQICRRISGAAEVAWLHVPDIEFSVLVDDSSVLQSYTIKSNSSFYFCPTCGSSIALEHPGVAGCVIAKSTLSDVSAELLQAHQHAEPPPK